VYVLLEQSRGLLRIVEVTCNVADILVHILLY
jgi:hypothetical protein